MGTLTAYLREYYRKSTQIFERLQIVQSQLGRSLYDLGRLLSGHNAPEAQELLLRAETIYRGLTGKELGTGDQDPFKPLIHAFFT